MNIYRVWKVCRDCGCHDKEIAFFTNKKKALNLIESLGFINSIREDREVRSKTKWLYNPDIYFKNTDITKKNKYYQDYAKEYWELYYSKNYVYEVFHNGCYYIQTIQTEN